MASKVNTIVCKIHLTLCMVLSRSWCCLFSNLIVTQLIFLLKKITSLLKGEEVYNHSPFYVLYTISGVIISKSMHINDTPIQCSESGLDCHLFNVGIASHVLPLAILFKFLFPLKKYLK